MRRALLERPVLHRRRDLVGERRVEGLAQLDGPLQAAEDLLRQALALGDGAEDVGAEDAGAGGGQVAGPDRPVRAPLGGGDVLLANSWHGAGDPPGPGGGSAGLYA